MNATSNEDGSSAPPPSAAQQQQQQQQQQPPASPLVGPSPPASPAVPDDGEHAPQSPLDSSAPPLMLRVHEHSMSRRSMASSAGASTPPHSSLHPMRRVRSFHASSASLVDLVALQQQRHAAEAAAMELILAAQHDAHASVPHSVASLEAPASLRGRVASLGTISRMLPAHLFAEPAPMSKLVAAPGDAWHSITALEACEQLHVDPLTGLTSSDAARRLEAFGRNELKGRGRVHPVVLFIRHLLNFLMILLLLASAVSFGVGEYVDGAVILAIAIANVVIGFAQEFRAEKTLEALRRLTASMANVVRDGKTIEVPSAELVPGDVVLVDASGLGSGIGADMRVLEAVQLDVVETTLTGESRPVHKTSLELVHAGAVAERFHANMLYSGCTVSGGRGRALVVRTGMSTELGKITSKVTGGKQRKTALQKELHRLALILFGVGIVLAVVVFASSGFDFSAPDSLKYSTVYAIAVIVAVIPEGLPLVLTLTMVLGVRRMAALNVVVRQLSALEQLGRVTDICSDKTGTITQAAMVAVSVWTPAGAYIATGSGVDPDGKLVPVQIDVEDYDYGFDALQAASDTDAIATAAQPPKPAALGPPSTPLAELPAPGAHAPPQDTSLTLLADIAAACNASQLARDETGRWRGVGQPTDVALQVLATKMGRGRPANRADPYRYAIVAEQPFDSSVKRMSVVVRKSAGKASRHARAAAADGHSVFVKGALERVLECCTRVLVGTGNVQPLPDAVFELLEPVLSRMAGAGQRVLALACRGACVGDGPERFAYDSAAYAETGVRRDDLERDLVLVGLVGLQDPPRPGVRQAVLDCVRGGITVRMLTGDHVATATSIAGDVCIASTLAARLPNEVMDAADFDALSEVALGGVVELPRVVARCTPDSKVKMIRALHARQRVVVMTGDGVNDAPALRSADVGVAMGRSGSDVTRQAAHIVLADDNFVSIVSAIREGRRIFHAIKRYVMHVLASNLGMVLMMIVGLLVRDPNNSIVFPMSPLAILWLNMVVLSVPLMGIVVEAPADDVMASPPRHRQSVLTRDVIVDIAVYGGLLTAIGLAALLATLYGQYFGIVGTGCNSAANPLNCEFVRRSRGTAFIVFAAMLIVNAYNCRDPYAPVWRGWRERPFNKLLFVLCATVAASVVLIVYVPGLNTYVFQHEMVTVEWGIAVACIAVHFVLSQLWKLLKARLLPPPVTPVALPQRANDHARPARAAVPEASGGATGSPVPAVHVTSV